jgi:NAD+ diphosphatase
MPSFTSRLPLSRSAIDRDHVSRDRPELFSELWADPATRLLVLWRGQALLDPTGALALVPVAELGGAAGVAAAAADDPADPADAPIIAERAHLAERDAEAVEVDPLFGPTDTSLALYLGRLLSDGTPVVALALDDDEAKALVPTDAAWGTLRDLGATLSDRDAGLFTEALAMVNWHEVHAFSPRTGEPSTPGKAGWVRTDGVGELYPRTDPAIIVGITDAEDRLLLGRNAMWPADRYSLLAGFVEPGESLEAAVVREVFEESGVRAIDPVYLGSQPWPFPASLMLGFVAKVDPTSPGRLTPDGEEILDVRWFARDELTAEVAAGTLKLPGATSIARAIIEHWYGGPIEAA